MLSLWKNRQDFSAIAVMLVNIRGFSEKENPPQCNIASVG
jgi:hypothetical protein